MRQARLDHTNLKLLTTSVFVLATLGILLWHDAHSYAASLPAPPISTQNVSVIPVPVKPMVKSIGVPTRIEIPGIGVNATVEQVTLTSDGSMAVPKLASDAGWYASGTRPGEVGSAVMAGHVNWWYGASSVFVDLHKLKPGAKIIVQDKNGADVSFVVRKTESYNAAADATDIFTSTDGQAHLNLITCDGVWISSAKQYSARLVVFADKE